jgi:hypothetical protein
MPKGFQILENILKLSNGQQIKTNMESCLNRKEKLYFARLREKQKKLLVLAIIMHILEKINTF